SDIAPAAFYNAIAAEEDYLNALQQHHQAVQAAAAMAVHNNNNGTATLITANGQIGTIQPMQIQLNGDITGYGTIAAAHHHHVDHSTMANTTYHLVGSDGTLISVRILFAWFSLF
ncbi:hypothetical protein BLA29_001661, partial [Euroglyphus maynei]